MAQPVTISDLENAASDNSSWLTYGRDYYGQRFVRLEQITPANVHRLHPAWVFATGRAAQILATPLIHDGVLYLSADQSRVFAIDARTGRGYGLIEWETTSNGSTAAARTTAAALLGVWSTSARWTPDGRP
jgi:glucose dehydrogenase